MSWHVRVYQIFSRRSLNKLEHKTLLNMKKITALLLTCLVALAAFSAMAIDTSDFVIDEGKPAGDVNNDERVNVSDVSTLINMILGSTAMDQSRADIDNNGQVNVSDVTALINIILGTSTGGSIGGSVITMADFIPNSGSTSGTAPLHQWTEGDVIFIAVDPDYSSDEACKNVYAMVRTGGKWVLRDVNGNNKQGFKTSGGTLCAAYVQHADLENSYYDYIPLKGDVACVNKAANYSVTLKDNKFYITIRDLILYHWVSRVDVYAANEGDYFYGSVTHLDALTRIMRLSQYTYGSFETSSRAPVIDIDSQHRGHAYGVWKKGTRTDGWLTLNYAKSNGYAYWWNYTQDELSQGRYLTNIYSPWQNGWNRDLSMQYYNYDDRTTYRQNAGSTYQNVNINVGTNIIFRPYDGNNSDSRGTMTSVTSSPNGIIDINYDNTQVSVTAHKVGTTTLNIKFKTKDNINCTYTYEVKVGPTVWMVGSQDDHPAIWRNTQRRATFYNNDVSDYNSIDKIFVHGNTAHILLTNSTHNISAKTAIFKTTGASTGGVFGKYVDGLKWAVRGVNNNYTTTVFPKLWVDKNNNVYYTSGDEVNSERIITTLYKNKSAIYYANPFVIDDILVDDNTGKIYLAGLASNLAYGSLGADMTSSLIVVDGTSAYYYPFQRTWIKKLSLSTDGSVYAFGDTFYKYYNSYQDHLTKAIILKYTTSSGLNLFAGDYSATGESSAVWEGAFSFYLQEWNLPPFIYYNSAFYYGDSNFLSRVLCYKFGASSTIYADDESLNIKWTNYFNIKDGIMYLANKSDNKMYLYSGPCQNFNSNTVTIQALEDSNGAIIRDVYVQTNLDD